jgi:shikimate kinase
MEYEPPVARVWTGVLTLVQPPPTISGAPLFASRLLHAMVIESPAQDAPIFLIGFMATGKTTVSKLLAKRLGWSWVDLDDVIADEAGATVRHIFETEGEAGFRAREARALRALGARRRTVVATGGGAACFGDNLEVMLAAGRVVSLEVTPQEAVRRARGGPSRPLLEGGADPLAAATTLLAARAPFYARANLRVDTMGLSPLDVARFIQTALERSP